MHTKIIYDIYHNIIYISNLEYINSEIIRTRITYHCFIILFCTGIDADDHSDLAFTIKIIFEQMGHPIITIWHILQ